MKWCQGKEVQYLDVVVSIQGEPMIYSSGENNHATFLHRHTNPTVTMVPHVKIPFTKIRRRKEKHMQIPLNIISKIKFTIQTHGHLSVSAELKNRRVSTPTTPPQTISDLFVSVKMLFEKAFYLVLIIWQLLRAHLNEVLQK